MTRKPIDTRTFTDAETAAARKAARAKLGKLGKGGGGRAHKKGESCVFLPIPGTQRMVCTTCQSRRKQPKTLNGGWYHVPAWGRKQLDNGDSA